MVKITYSEWVFTMVRVSSLIVLCTAFASSTAWAKPAIEASFSCAKAKTILERTICSDSRLAAADVSMAKAFRAQKKQRTGGALESFMTAHNEWLKTRSNCELPIVFPDDLAGSDEASQRSYRIESLRLSNAVDCLVKLYTDRTMRLMAPPSIEASFPCAAAKTMLEKVICSDTGLAAADRRMSQAYSRVRKTLKQEQRTQLLAEQRAWNRTRMECALPVIMPNEVVGDDEGARRSYRLESIKLGSAIQCLMQRYGQRIEALRAGQW